MHIDIVTGKLFFFLIDILFALVKLDPAKKFVEMTESRPGLSLSRRSPRTC